MKVSLIVATAALAIALPAAAQSTSTPQRPALLSDTTLRADDSPLVRAAKMAVASRFGGSIVIDYDYMRHTTGRISQAAGPALTPVNVGGARTAADHSSNLPAPPAPVDRAATQQKVQNLRQEQQRMGAETLEPYGGDVSQEQAEKRMSEIPKEINKLQPQQPPPPPPPQ